MLVTESCNQKSKIPGSHVNSCDNSKGNLFNQYLESFQDYNLDSIDTREITHLLFLHLKTGLGQNSSILKDSMVMNYLCDAINFDCIYRDLGNDSTTNRKYYSAFAKQKKSKYYKLIYRIGYEDEMHDSEIFMATYDLEGHRLAKLYIGNDLANCYRDSMVTRLKGDSIYIVHRTIASNIRRAIITSYINEIYLIDEIGNIKIISRRNNYTSIKQ